MLLRVPLPSTVPSVASILDGYLAQVANSEAAASAVCNVGANKSAKKSAAATARVAATAEAPTAAPSSSTVVNDVIPGPTTAEGTGGNLSTPAPGMATATAVVEGIRSYFDRALSTFLLYRFERPQYDALIRAQRAGTDAPRMSQVRCRSNSRVAGCLLAETCAPSLCRFVALRMRASAKTLCQAP